MAAPMVFVNAGRVFRADTCEPLKAATRQGSVSVQAWSRGNYPGLAIPGVVMPGVLSVGVWDAPARQTWGLGEHCNEGLEITFLSRGTLDFSVQGRPHRLGAGDLSVTAPWRPHEVGRPHVAPSRLIWCIIDLDVRRPNQDWRWPDWILLSQAEKREVAQVIQNSDRAVWQAAALAPLFDQVNGLLQTGDPISSETDMKIVLNTILLRVARTVTPNRETPIAPRDGARETVRLFLERLSEHLDYPWKVEEMARQCGLSRGLFIVKCRELLNRTPHAYLAELRLALARQLLRENRVVSLTDIAMRCGYSSSAHFSSSFRKEMGQSPSQFRRVLPDSARVRGDGGWPVVRPFAHVRA